MSEAVVENKGYGDYRDHIPELKELEEIVDEESSNPGSETGAIEDKENPKEVADAGNADEGRGQEEEVAAQEDKAEEHLSAQLKAAEEKMHTLQAELEGARQQLASAQPIQITPTRVNPFSNVNTPEELNQKVEEAWAFKRWASKNPDGATYRTADGQEVEISPEQMYQMQLDAEEAIQIHAPRRAAYLQDKLQYDVQAKEAYPDLFKSGSPQAVELNTLISQWPEVTRFSDYKLVLGDYLAGRKLREERAKKAIEDQKKPAAKSKIPVAPPVPNSRGGSQFNDSKSTLKKSEHKFFASGGNRDSLADLFEAKSRANNF